MFVNTQPLVTIVTPSFNQAAYIEQTIKSVLNQDYRPIEHLIIDGGSTDGTLEILKRYEDHVRWISEPDCGQGDAINKGFRQATGSILAWLNADDLFTSGALKTVVAHFQANPQSYFVYGDSLAINEKGRSYGRRAHVAPCNFETLLNKGDFIVQPSAFWRAELWRDVGELDVNWRYVLDYDYWLRAAQKYDLFYVPRFFSKERLYASAKTFSGGLERIDELEQMARRYGGAGIAANFRPEAAAVYVDDAWTALKHGQWGDSPQQDQRSAQNEQLHFKTAALYFCQGCLRQCGHLVFAPMGKSIAKSQLPGRSRQQSHGANPRTANLDPRRLVRFCDQSIRGIRSIETSRKINK